MSERSVSQADVLGALRESVFRDLHVAFVARVVSYDSATQTAEVQPLVSEFFEEEDGTITQVDAKPISGVPVAFFGAGGFRMTWPIQDGDTGLCLVLDRSADAWLAQGGKQRPADLRRHNVTDSVFFPGLHPNNAAWTGASATAVTLGKDGGPLLKLRATTIELGDNSDSVALASKVDARLAQLAAAINGIVPGSVTPLPMPTVASATIKAKD